jgi:hypothetical protein
VQRAEQAEQIARRRRPRAEEGVAARDLHQRGYDEQAGDGHGEPGRPSRHRGDVGARPRHDSQAMAPPRDHRAKARGERDEAERDQAVRREGRADDCERQQDSRTAQIVRRP